jgi:hypothetical protein
VVLVGAGNPTPEAATFKPILEHFTPIKEAWLSWIDPGGYIVAHRDGGPFYERWHVPLCVSGAWGDGTTNTVGVSFRVDHWEPHAVTVGDTPRVHVVIDRDIIANPSTAPFIIEESHG